MMKHRVLAVGLAAVLTLGASVPAFAGTVVAENYPAETTITICQDSPTMFTDEQLSELAATAPDMSETRSTIDLSDNRKVW